MFVENMSPKSLDNFSSEDDEGNTLEVVNSHGHDGKRNGNMIGVNNFYENITRNTTNTTNSSKYTDSLSKYTESSTKSSTNTNSNASNFICNETKNLISNKINDFSRKLDFTKSINEDFNNSMETTQMMLSYTSKEDN